MVDIKKGPAGKELNDRPNWCNKWKGINTYTPSVTI